MNTANPPPQIASIHHAFLYSRRNKRGYVYDVVFDGETVIAGSHNSSHQFARALLARGISGEVQLLNGKTGQHRVTIPIEGAAELSVVKDDTRGLRVVPFRAFPDMAERRKRKKGKGQRPALGNMMLVSCSTAHMKRKIGRGSDG